MGLSSLVAGDFILGGPIIFKICQKPSYEWAVVTKAVEQLKFLQFSNFIYIYIYIYIYINNII